MQSYSNYTCAPLDEEGLPHGVVSTVDSKNKPFDDVYFDHGLAYFNQTFAQSPNYQPADESFFYALKPEKAFGPQYQHVLNGESYEIFHPKSLNTVTEQNVENRLKALELYTRNQGSLTVEAPETPQETTCPETYNPNITAQLLRKMNYKVY